MLDCNLSSAGAEILVDSVKDYQSKENFSADWIELWMKHIRWSPSATMMYGHVENKQDIVDHFYKIVNYEKNKSSWHLFLGTEPNNTLMNEGL